MKPKHRRLIMISLSLLVMAGAAAAILYSFRENMVFFYTPSQLREKTTSGELDANRVVRVGGLVKKGSIKNLKPDGIRFTITDLKHELNAEYHGMVPSLFRDNQGVVAQGKLDSSGVIQAESILAKHDEKYMPREVVDALKESGEWKEGDTYTVPKMP